mgnify:FL=1
MRHIYDKVLEARQRLQGVIAHTPLSYAPVLSQLSLSEIYLKKENLQLTGAFKIRGALIKSLHW